ncbi:MAG: hypothetical protein JWP00_2928 [Chloroflexi bacterium]|jgi:hypothetical protein|nr:hypothetical protein [Chloroflexota bacterium]
MSDPHIDIDEIDNPQAVPPGVNEAATDGLPKEPAGGFGLSDLLATMSQQASRWQERINAGTKMGLDLHIIPPEAKKHLISSQREFLLAWRALIDYSLEKLDTQEQREAAREQGPTQAPPKATKIQVEEFEI